MLFFFVLLQHVAVIVPHCCCCCIVPRCDGKNDTLNNQDNSYNTNTNDETQYNNNDLAVYWHNYHIKKDTYPVIMCETQHKMFALTPMLRTNN